MQSTSSQKTLQTVKRTAATAKVLQLASNLDINSPRAPVSLVSPSLGQSVSLKAERPALTSDHISLNNKAETIQAQPMQLKDKMNGNARSRDDLLSASTKLRSEKAK
jgi:hypothetical protein